MDSQPPLGRLLLAPARSSGAVGAIGVPAARRRQGAGERPFSGTAGTRASDRWHPLPQCPGARLVRLASAARCNLIELELRALRLDELLEQGVCLRAPPETSSPLP